MKKRQLNLPAGHHDADSASQLLGVSKRKLLATLREAGFLDIDKANGLHGKHNLPRRHIKELGWAYEHTLSYGVGEGKSISHEYSIVIFTPQGFREIKKIMADPENYQPPQKNQPQAQSKPAENKAPLALPAKKLNSSERDQCMQQLREWGLAG